MKAWLASLPEWLQKPTEQNEAELLAHPAVEALRTEHSDLPEEALRRALPRLRQFVQERAACEACPGLERCPNALQGYRSRLAVHRGTIDLVAQSCPLLQEERTSRSQAKLFRTHRIPREVREATFDSLLIDTRRSEAIKAAASFCRAVRHAERPLPGLYLYGPFGVGKSHIAGAIANRLATDGCSSYMFYVPDFLRNIQEAITERSIGDQLVALKEVDVLILDDLGAETLTPWKRDEVLGAILQYRTAEGKPIVYTSNLSLPELQNHFATTERGGVDSMKAKRLMERITPHVTAYSVHGINWRNRVPGVDTPTSLHE